MKLNRKLKTKLATSLLSFILASNLFAADVTSTINKSGEDYNTLTIWEDTKDGNLASANLRQIAELYAEQGALDDRVAINGSTTDADYYMMITVPAADRHDGKWNTSKSRIVPTSDGTVIDNLDNYTRIEWLQIYPLSSAVSSRGIKSSNINTTINHCIIDGHGSTLSNGIYFLQSNNILYRNVVYDCDRSFYGGIRQAGGSNCIYYYNTVFRCDGAFAEGIRMGGTSAQAIGNAVFDCTDNWEGSFQAGSGYNADNDGVGTPGSNNQTSKDSADQFTAEGTPGSKDFDCHLKVGADCIDNGGAGTGSPYDYDIDNVQVTGTWDIGADEYVAAGGAVKKMQPMILILE